MQLMSARSGVNQRFLSFVFVASAILLLATSPCSLAQSAAAAQPQTHAFVHVSLGDAFPEPVSGRLLLFVGPRDEQSKDVDLNMMALASVHVAAKEVPSLKPGASVDIDVDDIVFPGPISQMSAGSYRAQAVLDVHHSYNYDGRSAGDLASDTVDFTLPISGNLPSIVLSRKIPEPPDPLADRADLNAAIEPIDFVSPALTRFWGRDIHMRGWVVLPPGYASHASARYPTVYFTHGFGGTLAGLRARYAPSIFDRMKRRSMPEMIWVLLDESSATGTHEFADSVNNGPWGQALTTELIPRLESTYRMDARPSGRFLQGHSSGGWATLWLQTRYPKIFGGTWSTSPDPSDFHYFCTVDLYAPHANMFRKPDGTLQPIVRVHGQAQSSLQELSAMESVLGPYGGQLASFEWVFSPRGPDGRPLPIFNRSSGDIDPNVAAYWRVHYDIVQYLNENWRSIGPDIKGKIHLVVGTDDTFYLDGAAHSLKETLDHLGGDGHFTFAEGRNHFDLYTEGSDRMALLDRIANEMYKVARPGGK